MQNFNQLPPIIQWNVAENALMSGPRAQKPTARAIRKTIRRMKADMPLTGGWRSWPQKSLRGH